MFWRELKKPSRKWIILSKAWPPKTLKILSTKKSCAKGPADCFSFPTSAFMTSFLLTGQTIRVVKFRNSSIAHNCPLKTKASLQCTDAFLLLWLQGSFEKPWWHHVDLKICIALCWLLTWSVPKLKNALQKVHVGHLLRQFYQKVYNIQNLKGARFKIASANLWRRITAVNHGEAISFYRWLSIFLYCRV